MAFQTGLESIGLGVTTVNATFPVTFSSSPDFVIAVVRNTVDNPQLRITTQTSYVDSSGFTAELDGTTDSANYTLNWIAGDIDLLLGAFSTLGIRITDLAHPDRELQGNDKVAMVQDGTSRQVPFSDFQSAFPLKAAASPTAASDSGVVSQISVDTDHAYFHQGGRWNRIPYAGHPTDWTIPATNSTKPAQGGTETLTDTATDVTIVYPHTFPAGGSLPQIHFSLQNILDVSPTAIYGFITASSLTGFTVDFSTAIDSTNWKMHWHAIQF
jgi:hypothetical protein